MLEKLSRKSSQWYCETKALRIRSYLRLSPFQPLDPCQLAARLGMKIVSLIDLNNLEKQAVKELVLDKANSWSGCCSGLLSDGTILIVLNPTQARSRQAATLMEEICHVLLGHGKSRLLFKHRSYNAKIEREAFAVGAAALLPHAALMREKKKGSTEQQIATQFGVTPALVRYRLQYLGS